MSREGRKPGVTDQNNELTEESTSHQNSLLVIPAYEPESSPYLVIPTTSRHPGPRAGIQSLSRHSVAG